MGFDLSALTIDHVELTNDSGGETLTRFGFGPGEIVVGDSGYAHRKGLLHVAQANAHHIVRLNWQNLPLRDRTGRGFELMDFLRGLPEVAAEDADVVVAPSHKDGIPALPARPVAVRKSETAAAASRARVLRERSRRSRAVDPCTLESAGYVFVLTSLPAETLSATETLELSRFRWQIELAFKRLKSLLALGDLPARDPPLARTVSCSPNCSPRF